MSLDIRPNPSASAGGVTGGLVYKGSYDAALQSPNLVNSTKGDFYIVSDAGSLAGIALNIGDHIVFNQDASSPITSSMFDVIDNTDAVASVNTKTGVVVLDTDDISEGSNQYFTNARADGRIGAANLTDLNDVNYTAGAGIDNFVLTYNHANTRWEAEASSGAVSSVNTQTGAVVLDTDDVSEGSSNLYYTNARFDTQLGTKTTDNLTEGSSNLYYTNARFDTQLGTKTTDNVTEGSSNLYYTNARFDTQLGTKDTDNLSEGSSNLYFTNARADGRADARIGASNLNALNDVAYTPGAGIDNYVLTYDNSSSTWGAEVVPSAPVTSVNTQTGAVVLDTDDVSEGSSNLYYTNARFDTQLGTKTTDNLTEGSSNLYYTNARFDTQLGTKDTGDLSEGSNLYYTNARADARIGAANLTDLNDVNYTAGAGIDGQFLKYVNANNRWEAASAPTSSDTLNDVVGRGATTSTPITVGDLKINSDSSGASTSGSIATLASNNNIKLDPHGSGVPELVGNATRGSGQIQFNCEQNSHGIILKGPPHSAAASYTMILPDGLGSNGQFLQLQDSSTGELTFASSAASVSSVNTQTGAVVLDTDDVSEGSSNLYYTNARFDTQLGTKTTDNLTEGSSNLYYTNARFDTQLGTKDTGDLSEGSNLYYTNARADARIGAANLTDLNDVNYTAGAGINGYVLTYNHSNTRWEAAAASAGGSRPSVTSITAAAYTIGTTDSAIGSSELERIYTCSSSASTVTLPSSSGLTGFKVQIKNLLSSTITIDPSGAEQIDSSGAGVALELTVQYSSVTLCSDGTGWIII